MEWVTTSAILDGLEDHSNHVAWEHLVRCFTPAIQAYARRVGLDGAAVQDVSQATLADFVDAYQRGAYDRSKGRLSTWLFTIARRRVVDALRRGGRDPAFTGDDRELEGSGDEEAQRRAFAEVWEAAVMQHCLARVRGDVAEATFQAFERTYLGGESTEEVARDLGMTANAVFIARYRVLGRLRKLGEELDDVR